MFEDELISKASELGFLACGIAKAEKLQEHEIHSMNGLEMDTTVKWDIWNET